MTMSRVFTILLVIGVVVVGAVLIYNNIFWIAAFAGRLLFIGLGIILMPISLYVSGAFMRLFG